MNSLGDEQFFEEIRNSLLPPRPRAVPIDYGYSILRGRGLGMINRFDKPPVLMMTLFATPDQEAPIVFDIEHAYPWDASNGEMSDILRIITSLHLTAPESIACSDRVVMREHQRMQQEKMAFAMLAGWSEDYPSMEPQAVTLTFNKRIGVSRSLAAFTNSVYQMVLGEVNGMFTSSVSAIDSNYDITGFPKQNIDTTNLSKPMN